MSLSKLDTIKTRATDPKEAGQYNSSSNRTSLSLELKDLPKGFTHYAALDRRTIYLITEPLSRGAPFLVDFSCIEFVKPTARWS